MPAMKPGRRAFMKSEKARKLHEIQSAAIREGWFEFHYMWFELNELRKDLGMEKVRPVDLPTSKTFEV